MPHTEGFITISWILQKIFVIFCVYLTVKKKWKKTRGRKSLSWIFVQCRAVESSRRKGERSCLSFRRFLNFWWVLSRSFITAYDVAKTNTCVLELWTFPHHNRCYVNSVESCPESKPCILCVRFCSRSFTCDLQKPKAAATCSTARLKPVDGGGERGFRLIPLEAICFSSKTISYLCILPNYLKQTVGYAGSQITAHTHTCTHIYYTHIDRKK